MISPTLKKRLCYTFDSDMSIGTLAYLAGLDLLSLVVILLVALLTWLDINQMEAVQQRQALGEAFWGSRMRTLDSGTMGRDRGWASQ